MKYAVFAIAALGTAPLAFMLSLNVRWMKYAFWAMAVSMCLFQQTAINFFSHELYRGSARGMEVSLVYLLALAIFAAFAMRGIPALAAMLLWFAWYWFLCIRLLARLRGTEHYFVVAGIFGGLTANFLQSALEWVLRQQLNLICLMFLFALLSYLDKCWRKPAAKPAVRAP